MMGWKFQKIQSFVKRIWGNIRLFQFPLKESMLLLMRMHLILQFRLCKEQRKEFQFLSDSEYLSEHDKSVYRELLDSNMSETVFCGGLKILSKLLEKHYRLKVILLIDEYDVPLAKAFENGYYEQMIFLIRNLLEQALKTNNSLKFAVMTGCMRIQMNVMMNILVLRIRK